MGFENIKPGKKIAKPKSARFVESKKGTLGMEIEFTFWENDKPESLKWQGWFSEAAQKRTMEILVNVLGFNGNDTVNASKFLSDPNALKWNQEVEIDVDIEEYEGKKRHKIKWINPIGSGGTKAPDDLKAKLTEVGFKAAFLAVKQTRDDNVPF